MSRLLDRAENSAEALEYAFAVQLEALASVRSSLADVVEAKRRVQDREAALRATAKLLHTWALEAMTAREEVLIASARRGATDVRSRR